MAQTLHAPTKLLEFIASELVCCLGVGMPNNGVHIAPLRFWCNKEDLSIYMVTARDSEKMWWLREGRESVSASIAIGLTDGLPYSVQMRGHLESLAPAANQYVLDQYMKIASSLNDPGDPKNVMIVFRPDWARYTDRSTPQKLTYPIDL